MSIPRSLIHHRGNDSRNKNYPGIILGPFGEQGLKVVPFSESDNNHVTAEQIAKNAGVPFNENIFRAQQDEIDREIIHDPELNPGIFEAVGLIPSSRSRPAQLLVKPNPISATAALNQVRWLGPAFYRYTFNVPNGIPWGLARDIDTSIALIVDADNDPHLIDTWRHRTAPVQGNSLQPAARTSLSPDLPYFASDEVDVTFAVKDALLSQYGIFPDEIRVIKIDGFLMAPDGEFSTMAVATTPLSMREVLERLRSAEHLQMTQAQARPNFETMNVIFGGAGFQRTIFATRFADADQAVAAYANPHPDIRIEIDDHFNVGVDSLRTDHLTRNQISPSFASPFHHTRRTATTLLAVHAKFGPEAFKRAFETARDQAIEAGVANPSFPITGDFLTLPEN